MWVREPSDRQAADNPGIDPNEPLYTWAEAEVMFNEMYAAKLAELGYVPLAQSQALTTPSASEKGKGPEVVNPMLVEYDTAYHAESLERSKPAKQATGVPVGPVKGKS